MSPLRAFADGVRRVHRAPAIVLGVWFTAALLVLPIALTLTAHSSGSSYRLSIRPGFGERWRDELNSATGVREALERGDLLAIALRNPVTLVDRESAATLRVLASTTFGFVWLFVAGGIIDRYARDRATRSHGFFQACGVFFFPFLRLGIVVLLVDMLISRFVPWPAASNAALAACGFVFDYTAVRAVVEDRRSILGAFRAALAFIARNPVAAVSLYAIQYASVAGISALYVAADPTSRIVWTVPGAIVINQLYAIGQIWIRLVGWSSETALFQSRLAHAGYVARREAVWPESPMVESLKP